MRAPTRIRTRRCAPQPGSTRCFARPKQDPHATLRASTRIHISKHVNAAHRGGTPRNGPKLPATPLQTESPSTDAGVTKCCACQAKRTRLTRSPAPATKTQKFAPRHSQNAPCTTAATTRTRCATTRTRSCTTRTRSCTSRTRSRTVVVGAVLLVLGALLLVLGALLLVLPALLPGLPPLLVHYSYLPPTLPYPLQLLTSYICFSLTLPYPFQLLVPYSYLSLTFPLASTFT